VSSQNPLRKVVPTLLVVCTIGWLSDVRAQDQVACGTRAETLVREAISLLKPGAGTGAQKPDGLGRVSGLFGERCVEESRCGPLELNMSMFEASLDDTIVALQRQKLEKFKAVIGVRTSRSEVCAAVLKLETLTMELKVINDQQLSRLDQLAPKLFADYVGFLR
jgi:hypothetical protein